jgi:hypothetical protein
MREEYKFRASDFIPIIGIFSYANRTKGGAYSVKSNFSSKTKPLEFIEQETKSKILVIYNIAVLTPLVMGLEKLLN